jgi:predicted lipoprotein with Yx(FWY)xxD motif
MTRTLLLLPVAALVLGACGSSGKAPPAATTTTTSATTTKPPSAVPTVSAPKPPITTVKVGPSQFGRILTDGGGRTLYLFTREKSSSSRCYGACAKAWPPLVTRLEPAARGAAQQKLLGTTTRRDGKRQVTYGGHPVYYYVGETKAGQVLCQNVDEFGGTWLVVSPSGAPVR